MIGFTTIVTALFTLTHRHRAHAGPGSRPQGRAVGDLRHRRTGRRGRADRRARPDARPARELRHRRARRPCRGREHHRRPARRVRSVGGVRSAQGVRHRRAAPGAAVPGRHASATRARACPGSSVPTGSTRARFGHHAFRAPTSPVRRVGSRRRGAGAGAMFARVAPPMASPDARRRRPRRRRPPTTAAAGVPRRPPARIVGPTLPATDVARRAPRRPTPPGRTCCRPPTACRCCLVGPAGGTGEVFERGSAEAGHRPPDRTVDRHRRPARRRAGDLEHARPAVLQRPVDVPVASVGDRARRRDPVGTDRADDRTSPARSRSPASFTEDEVRSLARVLNRGAFPVSVVQQRVETVSPTAGENSLRAAVIAGLIGVVADAARHDLLLPQAVDRHHRRPASCGL